MPPGPTTAPRRSFRINWARTLAASLLVALLEGVAFATAWWYVTPEQQGWLVVHTKPAGIQIAVDGLVLGKTPFAKALPPAATPSSCATARQPRRPGRDLGRRADRTALSWGNGFTSGQASIRRARGSKVSSTDRMMGKTPLDRQRPAARQARGDGRGRQRHRQHDADGRSGQTTELEVPVYAGWASVLSPVQLDILLEGKLVGSTEIEKLMLKPGKHTLELVNESLGYKSTIEVRVRPGATTSVSVVPKRR